MTDPVEVIALALATHPDGGNISPGSSLLLTHKPQEACGDLARAVLSALEGEGMAVVPVEPTLPMLAAGDSALCSALECTCQEGTIYRAMVVRRPR